MSEKFSKLSFGGEILISRVAPPHVKVEQTTTTEINIVKISKNGTFEIFVHTEGVTLNSSDKFYKFYSNGKLKSSSYFSPKKTLEISGFGEVPNFQFPSSISKKKFNKEIAKFAIQIFNKDPKESGEEIFNLKFHLFNCSPFWKNFPLMSTWSAFMEYFNYFCSKFKIKSDQSGVEVLSTTAEFFKLTIKLKKKKKKTLIIHYTDIIQIQMKSNHFEIILNSKSQRFSFNFESHLKNYIHSFFQFISMIFDVKYTFNDYPILIMEIDLVKGEKYLIQKEIKIQQPNLSESVMNIEQNT
jgi:hypothetical protein